MVKYFIEKDKMYMQKALLQATFAFEENEVPVGAIVVYKNQIIAKAHNQVERLLDPTAHAEMIVITEATNYLHSKWLKDCILYVTLEPCFMCAGALILSRVKTVVFGAFDLVGGAFGSRVNINNLKLNHKIDVRGGILEEDCIKLLRDFFKRKRIKIAY